MKFATTFVPVLPLPISPFPYLNNGKLFANAGPTYRLSGRPPNPRGVNDPDDRDSPIVRTTFRFLTLPHRSVVVRWYFGQLRQAQMRVSNSGVAPTTQPA